MKQHFYLPDYEKTDISSLIREEKLNDEKYEAIFKNTGVSPASAKKLLANGDFDVLDELNDLYFKKPALKTECIAYPVTDSERNLEQITPLIDLKNGDILVTFNTHTLDWRHGHCGMILDAKRNIMLEHTSVGYNSCLTYADEWGRFPGFVVLRYPDEEVSEKACEYAIKHLQGIKYNILAGIVKKDKSDEEIPESSHCSHIVWQAYKAAGVDIDETGGVFVTPKNIAMSKELEVVQIYGMNPENYKERIAK